MMKQINFFLAIFFVWLLGMKVSAQEWTPAAPADGGTYYLYNVGMRGFLTGGANRATIAPAPVSGQTVTLQADGDNFRINCQGLRANGGTDQWMVENWDDDYVYIDVNYGHNMHMPWKFTEVDGKDKVYNVTIVGGTDDSRRLEIDSRNNGVPDLNNRAGVVPYTRSTRQSSAGGNLVGGNDQWMLVTPADYEAYINNTDRKDFTSKVGLGQTDWTGASELGNDVRVTTADGRNTGIPAFYGTSATGTKISQMVTGLDNGIYEVKVFAHSHNERADHGTAAPGGAVTGMTDVAYVFAESGDSHGQVFINARGRDPLGWTKAEYLAPYTISNVTVKNGQVTIGLGLAVANQTQWQAIQIYSLVKTGDLPLTEKIEAYETALANANTTASDAGLPAGFVAALQTVIDANSGSNAPSYTSADELDAATAALNSAIVEAETARLPYDRYNAIKADVLALDDDATAFVGDAAVDVSDADAAVNAATTIDGINNAIPLLRTAAFNFINSVNVVPGKSFDLTKILIQNFDLEDGINGWTAEGDGTWRTMLSDGGAGYGAEFYHGTRNIYQSFTDLPQGRYQATVQATWRDAQSTALYLTTAKGTQNTQIQQLVPNNNPGEQLLAMHNNPDFAKITVDNSVTDGTLTIGLKEKVFGGDCWTLFDNFQLFYTGLDYSAEEAALAEAIQNAKDAAETLDIPAPMKERLNGTETTYVASDIEASGTYTEVIAAFTNAVETINALVEEAQNYVVPFARFNQMKNAVDAIKAQTEVYTDEEGNNAQTLDADVATAVATANAAEDIETIETATSDILAAIATFIKATNIPTKYFDLTSLIVNPGFEEGRNTGWNYEYDHNGGFNWMTRDAFHCVEFFNCTYNLNQTIENMPAGYYKVQVNGQYRPNNEYAPGDHVQENVDGYLYVTGGTDVQLQVLRGNVTSITTVHQAMDNGEYLNETKAVIDEDGNLTFGIKCETQRRDYSWTLIDDFRLLYTVEDIDLFLEPYNEAFAAAQEVDTNQPMNAEEKQELLNAIAADETLNKDNIATIQDATTRLQNATATAISSIAAYAEAKLAVDRINAEMEATNVATAEVVATFSAYQTAYDEGTLTDDDASALMRRTFRDGVNRDPANTIDEYLLSAWKEGDTQMQNYDGKLYINTWSTEADVEGFTYPFYEFADGWPNSTAAHTFTATVNGLEEGDYQVDIWIRTQINGNNTAVPEGITLKVNDGPAISVEGEVSGNFRADKYSVYGQVGTDGVLTFTLDIAGASYGTWLSFKNVKYTKIENVPEIAINETETFTPKEGVAHVTLTRTFNAGAWNSLVLPFDVENVAEVFGENVQVARYTGTEENDGLYTLLFEDADKITANEPVFIYNVTQTADNTYKFQYAQIKEGEAVAIDAAGVIDFIGSYAEYIRLEAGDFYIASDNNIYKVGENAKVNLKGTRAYFHPVGDVPVKGINLAINGQTTSISAPEVGLDTVPADAEIYNLSGQRLSKPQKGLNIINGKVTLVK